MIAAAPPRRLCSPLLFILQRHAVQGVRVHGRWDDSWCPPGHHRDEVPGHAGGGSSRSGRRSSPPRRGRPLPTPVFAAAAPILGRRQQPAPRRRHPSSGLARPQATMAGDGGTPHRGSLNPRPKRWEYSPMSLSQRLAQREHHRKGGGESQRDSSNGHLEHLLSAWPEEPPRGRRGTPAEAPMASKMLPRSPQEAAKRPPRGLEMIPGCARELSKRPVRGIPRGNRIHRRGSCTASQAQ